MGHSPYLLLVGALLSSFLLADAFRNGDFIQSARKSQFHSQRTHWHDLVGDACPRFGRDRLVVVMLPKPIAGAAGPASDEYKVQLAFDGDRHMTQWLKLAGKGTPSVPVVHVTLKRSGEELLGVSGKVADAPMHLQHSDPYYVSQWRNETHWPKRLLVAYKWDTHNDVDLDRGLVVLLSTGLVVCMLLGINAALGAGPKLAQFLTDIATELGSDMTAGGPSGTGAAGGRAGTSGLSALWKGGGKGE